MSSFPALYTAFRKANIPEEDAVAAADAVANAFADKNEITAIKEDTEELKAKISRVDERLTRIEYMGTGLYILITILVVPLFIKIVLV